MSELSINYPWLTDTRLTGPAQVLDVDGSGSYAYLQVIKDFEQIEIKARVAIPVPHKLQPGDIVLVMGENPDETYIIGILEQKSVAESSNDRIFLDGGTHARQEGQSLKVFSHKRELLFEFDEKTGKARINLESGDMEFVTRTGNISFAAGKDILLNGQTVGITSRNGIVMGMLDKLGKLLSTLTIKSDSLQLNSPEVAIEAQKGKFQIKETEITGKKLNAEIDSSKITVGRMEIFAQTILSSAKNVYNSIENLSQLKAGRMRILVENTFHLKSKKAMLKSEDDFKVRAEKIHLG